MRGGEYLLLTLSKEKNDAAVIAQDILTKYINFKADDAPVYYPGYPRYSADIQSEPDYVNGPMAHLYVNDHVVEGERVLPPLPRSEDELEQDPDDDVFRVETVRSAASEAVSGEYNHLNLISQNFTVFL